MRTRWKLLIALALVLPLAAYVVGTLSPTSADDGDRSRPVIIGEDERDPGGTPSPRDDETARDPDRDDDHDDEHDDDNDDRDDGSATDDGNHGAPGGSGAGNDSRDD